MKLHHACLPALVAGAILFAMPGTGVAAPCTP